MTPTDDDDLRSETNPLVRIPAGEYVAYCVKYEKSRYRGRMEKIYLHFKILDGEYAEAELFCVYNRYGRFPRGSKYYTDWSIANGAMPTRRDRMSPEIFMSGAFTIRVRDVVPKYEDGSEKPEMFRYSVVDRIIDRAVG